MLATSRINRANGNPIHSAYVFLVDAVERYELCVPTVVVGTQSSSLVLCSEREGHGISGADDLPEAARVPPLFY